MSAYDQLISRDASNDPLVPTPVSAQIIQEMPHSSYTLGLAQTVPMSSKTSRQPVLSALPDAYWVSGDTGLKSTSAQDWENLSLVAEELAVIIPIPEAYLDDSQIPVWDQVRPRIAAAFGKKLDQACFFGTSKPASWTSAAIIPGAVAAGNTVAIGTGLDIGVDIAQMGEQLDLDGFELNSFAARPGFAWKLTQARNASDNTPIYGPGNVDAGIASSLYGLPMHQVRNGSWDRSVASLVGGDFSKAIVGIRQDITFKIFTEGVISDDSGNVVLNLMQQDSVALRAVMRVGYALANPITELNSNGNTRFPFSVLTPTYSSGS